MLNNQDTFDDALDEWWSRRHRWLRRLHDLVPARFRFFDGVVKDWRGKMVLDIGCGGGYMAEALAKRGAFVTGIDSSPSAVEAARRHALAQGLRIDYRVGDEARLPLPDESMDCIVVVDVLEHQDPDPVLDEIRRVLKRDGVLLFDTINRTWLSKLIFAMLGRNILRLGRGTHDPSRFIRPEELAAKLRARGFVPARTCGLGPRGVNGRGDAVFGPLRTLSLQYLGFAIKRR